MEIREIKWPMSLKIGDVLLVDRSEFAGLMKIVEFVSQDDYPAARLRNGDLFLVAKLKDLVERKNYMLFISMQITD